GKLGGALRMFAAGCARGDAPASAGVPDRAAAGITGGGAKVCGALGAGFVPGLIAVLAMGGVVVYLIRKTDKELQREYALKIAA
ncbi:MAG: hypothetical protein IJN41_04030, partial [Firmicutes bacterium]|nr:hypothetical protein [Bacillota bacterium]